METRFLLALRETLPLSHKEQQSQILRHPKIGEIVLVKMIICYAGHRNWLLLKNIFSVKMDKSVQ